MENKTHFIRDKGLAENRNDYFCRTHQNGQRRLFLLEREIGISNNVLLYTPSFSF